MTLSEVRESQEELLVPAFARSDGPLLVERVTEEGIAIEGDGRGVMIDGLSPTFGSRGELGRMDGLREEIEVDGAVGVLTEAVAGFPRGGREDEAGVRAALEVRLEEAAQFADAFVEVVEGFFGFEVGEAEVEELVLGEGLVGMAGEELEEFLGFVARPSGEGLAIDEDLKGTEELDL
jgi:hypothetical protein